MPLFGDAYRNRMVIAAMAMVIGVVGSCGLAGAYCTAPAPAPEVAR
jgi:hypothetical protein